MVRNLSIATLLALSLVFCAANARAEQGTEKRFEIQHINGKVFIFDTYTGKLTPVSSDTPAPIDNAEGESVQSANPQVAQELPRSEPVRKQSGSVITKPKQPELVAQKPSIELDGDEVPVKPTQVANNVGSGITQKDREEAAGDISAYFNYLSTSMIVKQGNDGVTGNILIYNNGLRKIDTMEIALLVPMGEDYKTFRYVLQDGTKDAPPQPKPKNSSVSFPTYVKVNEASVPNGTGKCDVKITYIKFSK